MVLGPLASGGPRESTSSSWGLIVAAVVAVGVCGWRVCEFAGRGGRREEEGQGWEKERPENTDRKQPVRVALPAGEGAER